MKEHDFPTVRTGSYWIIGMLVLLVCHALWKGGDREITDMFQAGLAALGATHAMLVLGGGFINSKWGAPTAIESTRTVTEVQTVTPKAANEPVNTSQ